MIIVIVLRRWKVVGSGGAWCERQGGKTIRKDPVGGRSLSDWVIGGDDGGTS